MADTSWLSLGEVCKWFVTNRVSIQEYLEEKKPNCMPPLQWWVYVAAVEAIIKEVNVSFVAGQGLTTLVGEQKKSLDKLKRVLLEIVRGRRILNEEPDEFNFIQDDFVVSKADAIVMIKDCGLFYCKLFDELPVPIQDEVWRHVDVAKFVLALVCGIEDIEQQNDSSSGTQVPPVLPIELIQLRSHEFNIIVSEQAKRYTSTGIKTQFDLQLVQEQHVELISANRVDEPLRNAIQNLKNPKSFEDGWKCIGSGRFEELNEFCGSVATVFPGTATVEADFSVVNFEKNQYRSALTNLSLEGILHAKQYAMITTIASLKES